MVAIEAFKLVLTDVYQYLKTSSLVFSDIGEQVDHSQLFKHAINIEKVKTIWQIDRSVSISEFYYPSKIVSNNDSTITINTIDNFPPSCKLVIQGTAGQGKSIFLRYLAAQQLRSGSSIPLFIELRKISERVSIEHLILDSLRTYKINADGISIQHIFECNKFTILLDGFDEINEAYVNDSITYIENISFLYSHLRIIITSRPNSDIQKSSYFNVHKLAPLKSQDFKPMLLKLYNGEDKEETVNEIVKSIFSSTSDIKNLLTTPLLLTLLTICYRGTNRVPEKPHEFYSQLFHLLVSRHDSTKPGFRREFHTPLTEKELEDLFCAFCFYASIDDIVIMSLQQAVEFASKAKEITKSPKFSEYDFIKDCLNKTCLIIEEGLDYHFIHKSIREYHAANFIRTSPQNLKSKFYKAAMLKGIQYSQELFYLSVIDEYYFNEEFFIPIFDRLIDVLSYDGATVKLPQSILDTLVVTVDNDSVQSFSHKPFFEGQLDSYIGIAGVIYKVIYETIDKGLISLIIKNYEGEVPYYIFKDGLDSYVDIELSRIQEELDLVSLLEGVICFWLNSKMDKYNRAKTFLADKKSCISSIDF